jgi:glucose/arabinose dehydrogenase
MKRYLAVMACLIPLAASGQTVPAPLPNPACPGTTLQSYMPVYGTSEGKPIDDRLPEKCRDTRQFPEQTRAPYHHAADFKVTVLTDGLHAPGAAAILPDGNILVTEKLPGALRMVTKDGALSEPFTGLEGLHVSTPMMGLQDVVLDPDFASNHILYFTYFEYFDKTVGATSVGRAMLDEQAGVLHDVTVLLKTSPFLPNDQTLSAGSKTGGRIAIGADGFLYVTIGDRDNAGPRPWGVAQMLDTHLGKILRITKDGKPAPGNPFLNTPGALPEIWAIGFRTPEGLAFDGAGQLWETEHGPRGGDELNRIEKGKNYGWPVISHGIDYAGKVIGDDHVAADGMEQPVYFWSPSTAPSSLLSYRGKLFPKWKDSLFVGMLRGAQLDRLTMKDGKIVNEEALLVDLKSRIRDVQVDAAGALYVLTDSGGGDIHPDTPATSKLLKLTPP